MEIRKRVALALLLAVTAAAGGCAHSEKPLSQMENRRQPLLLDGRTDGHLAGRGHSDGGEQGGFFLWNWFRR